MFGSEWQENVTGTNTELCGIPRVFYISRHTLWQPDAEFSLHLTGPYLHGETAWIRNNSIAPFPPLCFHSPPKCRKMKWKGMEKEGKIMWKNLQPSKEMFDIDIGLWRWSTEPNVCVCDKTGVNLSSDAESKDFSPSIDIMFYCCFPATASQTSIFSHLEAMTSSFHQAFFLENHPFGTGGRVCLWICL